MMVVLWVKKNPAKSKRGERLMQKPSELQVKFSGKQRNQRNRKSAATKLRTNSTSFTETWDSV